MNFFNNIFCNNTILYLMKRKGKTKRVRKCVLLNENKPTGNLSLPAKAFWTVTVDMLVKTNNKQSWSLIKVQHKFNIMPQNPVSSIEKKTLSPGKMKRKLAFDLD